MDKWSISDLNKMSNWKKVKSDGVTSVRKKDLLVLWDLEQGRPEPTPQKRYEEEIYIDGGFNYEVE